ncbi:hypothetical protein RUND412_011622 [Rhizina undulata]
MANTLILNRTTLASTKFTDGNGLHLRVYYQDINGNIKESFWDQGTGWNLRGNGLVVKAKLNSPIAVVSWASGTQIRVYYLNDQNRVSEKVYSGGAAGQWTDGGLNSRNLQAAPYSQLAASQIGEGADLRIHVYFQDASNKIQEEIWASGWSKGSNTLPTALIGSSLASFALAASPGRWWLYYQDTSLKLKEVLFVNGSYAAGGYNPTGTFRPGASISAVAWGSTEIRVFAVNEDNELLQTAYQGNKWTGTVTLTTTVTDSGVAAIQWPNVQIRVYHQRTAINLKEWSWNGSAWVSGADVPLYTS